MSEFELPKSQMTTLASAALAPAEIEHKAEAAAVAKAALPLPRMFVLAMLAGAFISFGAAFFVMLLGDTTLTFAAQACASAWASCSSSSAARSSSRATASWSAGP